VVIPGTLKDTPPYFNTFSQNAAQQFRLLLPAPAHHTLTGPEEGTIMTGGPLHTVSLDDKYTVTEGRVLLTGIQALVRLPLMQRQRDVSAGLNTAGFISGYRGSPLGGVDQALWKAQKHLDAAGIVFKPGINEDLAATAVWGTQQLGLSKGARHQGVFALWYGKGPGVDRSMDVIKHGNAAGASAQGGVLLVTGDDHACKSSTFPHQSEQAYVAAMVPVLHAASVQDVLDLGLHGWAMSRFSGCWVALKLVSDVADATAVVDVSPTRPAVTLPTAFPLPEGGLNFRWPDPPVTQEHRLVTHKLPAALAYARANKLDRVTLQAATRASVFLRRARPISMSGRRWMNSAFRTLKQLRSAFLSIKSRCRGRWSRKAPRSLLWRNRHCWWWKKSAL
jgi:hypothetical protein